jgi:hypothetical protein
LLKAAGETVVVPEDGVVHMSATLEEDENSLRAAGSEAMEMGTIIVIAAYDENGDYVTKAEYEVTDTSGGIKPTAADGRGIIITTTGDYTFVAYSLNEKESFVYSGNMGPYSADDPDDDPLWGSSLKVTVRAGMNRVTIEMRHVFSRVTLKALSGDLAGSPTISNVSATWVGYQAVLLEGVVGTGVAEDQGFANFPATPASEAYSAQRAVYAGNEDITTIKINSATIGGTTHMGSVARFNHKLLPGRSYTLTVKFDELEWAWSNIYWVSSGGNDGYLTFDTTDEGHQGFQGVFFKWGSLVGISPATTAGAGNNGRDFSGATRIYVPYGYPDDPKWKATSGNAVGADNAIPGTSNWTAWGNIPYVNSGGSSADRKNTYLMDVERNNEVTYKGLRGDICQYLSMKTGVVVGDYRLPTSYEFGTCESGNSVGIDGWDVGGTPYTDNTLGIAEGTLDLFDEAYDRTWAKNSLMGGVTFPGSGYRSGTANSIGNNGYAWSGSSDGLYLWFYGFYVSSYTSIDRGYAFPVRCVRN